MQYSRVLNTKIDDETLLYIALTIIGLILIIYFLSNNNKAVRIAKRNVGQLEKTTGSYEMGFQNKKFETKMRQNGFSQGYDWCAIFAKSVIMKSVSNKKKAIINQLMNPSSQQTYNNLVNASTHYNFIEISEKPIKGAVVVWQSVSKPAFGHVGIVSAVSGANFTSIEGNVSTNTAYDGVAVKQHSLFEKHKTSGLKLRKYFIKIN